MCSEAADRGGLSGCGRRSAEACCAVDACARRWGRFSAEPGSTRRHREAHRSIAVVRQRVGHRALQREYGTPDVSAVLCDERVLESTARRGNVTQGEPAAAVVVVDVQLAVPDLHAVSDRCRPQRRDSRELLVNATHGPLEVIEHCRADTGGPHGGPRAATSRSMISVKIRDESCSAPSVPALFHDRRADNPVAGAGSGKGRSARAPRRWSSSSSEIWVWPAARRATPICLRGAAPVTRPPSGGSSAYVTSRSPPKARPGSAGSCAVP